METLKTLMMFIHTLATKLFNMAGEPTHLKIRVGVVEDESIDHYVEMACVRTGKVAKLRVFFDNAFDHLDRADNTVIQAILNYAVKLGYRVKKLHWGHQTIEFRHYPEIVLYDRLRINRFRLPETIDVIRKERIVQSKSDASDCKVLIKNTGTTFDGQVLPVSLMTAQ